MPEILQTGSSRYWHNVGSSTKARSITTRGVKWKRRMSHKCVVIGDVDGQFAGVFTKLTALHAKNAFAFAIVAGNLFSPVEKSEDGPSDDTALDDLLSGQIKVPLPTYFALGKRPLPSRIIKRLESNNGEVCENLFFLGKRTTIKTSEGVRVVALGGSLDLNVDVGLSKDSFGPAYSNGDAQALKGAHAADILVTNDWPENIHKGSKAISAREPNRVAHKGVADLCGALKPKYHFTTSDSFIEREPFFHAPDEGSDPAEGYRVTRFISLAPYGNNAKQKWIYAFSIDPTASSPVTLPRGTTASPLNAPTKKRPAPDQQGQEYSRYSNATAYGDSRPIKRLKGQGRQAPPGPAECFFCLSNPNSATHIISSIGDNAYMTTAKGPLTTSSTYSRFGLNTPGHMLIIPLAHSATIAAITDPQSRQDTMSEMDRFTAATQRMLSNVSGGKLGIVTWEISRSEGIHAHQQLLPVPIDLIQSGLVETAFKVEAENDHYPAFHVTENEADAAESGDYFRVWIDSPSEIRGAIKEEDSKQHTNGTLSSRLKVLTLPLSSDFRFDLQFGRRVMAKLLSLEKRVQWRDCAQSVEDETADAERWKGLFKDYDFTLQT